MTVESVPVLCTRRLVRRAIRKCLTAMRQKLTYNKKMLSVVSAGATAGVGGMDRLRGGGRTTPSKHMHPMDIRRNLPHSISLPDGENHPFNGRLQIRDAEQQSEILQKCIRPPPNRTVLESESPPSYRSGSGGSCNEWSLLSGTRSNSTSSSASSSKRPDTITGASTSSSCSISPSDGCAAGGSSSSSGGGQKTDFIQKTVKIFTGKKSQQQQQPPPAPAPTLLPQVLVPTARSRRPIPNEPHHQQQQQHHHNNQQQQQQQQQNNGNAPRPHKPNV